MTDSLRFAARMESIKASEIRELLKLTERPDMISFAGGLPNPKLFPVQALESLSARVIRDCGRQALQYAATEGYGPLRDKIARRMNRKLDVNVTAANLLITSGSQQGLDLTGKAFLDEGDVVLCESPSYLGAIQAFTPYRPTFIEVDTDSDGMNPDHLRQLLQTVRNVKLIYVVPDFQNPTGRCWSRERRERLVRLADEFNVIVVEDHPYGDLRFEGEPQPSVLSFDREGRVVHLGTFSKTFCPGYRIGWTAASPEVLNKYVLLKQATDLHTSNVGQRVIDSYLEENDLENDIAAITDVYRRQRDVMFESLAEHMPEGVSYEKPSGGLFVWVELPEGMDARKLLVRSLEENVAFVPGGAFYPNGGRENAMRLNFSTMDEPRIREGIRRLAGVVRAAAAGIGSGA